MRTNYHRGRDREYYVERKLKEQGALLVKRAYASKGPVDLIAIFPSTVRLVQVKKNGIPRAELETLKVFASRITADATKVELWVFKGKGHGVEVSVL